MKYYIFILFLVLINIPLSAQKEKIYQPDGITYESLMDWSKDSLIDLSETVVNDTLRARIFIYLSFQFEATDAEKEQLYLNKALKLSEEIAYKRGIGIVKNNQGGILQNKGQYGEALKNYSEAFDIAESIEDTSFMIVGLQNMSSIYEAREEIETATAVIERAVKLSEKMANPHPLAMMGLYRMLSNFRELNGNFEEAILYLNKALAMTEEGSFYNGLTLINMAMLYERMGNYDLMKKFGEEANLLNATIQSPKIQIIYHEMMGEYYLKITQELPKAEENLLKGLAIAREIQDRSYQADILKSLIKLYKQKGDFEKSTLHHDSLRQVAGQLHELNNESEMLAILDKFEAKEKAQQIEILKKEQQLREEQITRGKLITLGIAILAILAGLGLWFYFKNRVRMYQLRSQVAQQAKELSDQKMKNMQRDMQLKVLQSNLQGQLVERQRIAKDLHDSLGGLLASIKLQMISSKRGNSEPILKSIDRACDEVRTISHHLHPPAFQEKDFLQIIEELIENFNLSPSLNITLDINTPASMNTLSMEQKIEIYRILQELIYNTQRHAEAKNVYVSCTFHDQYLSIMVEDDGKGFSTEKTSFGLGLESIANRAKTLNADWHIDSAEGRGTVAQLSVPLILRDF